MSIAAPKIEALNFDQSDIIPVEANESKILKYEQDRGVYVEPISQALAKSCVAVSGTLAIPPLLALPACELAVEALRQLGQKITPASVSAYVLGHAKTLMAKAKGRIAQRAVKVGKTPKKGSIPAIRSTNAAIIPAQQRTANGPGIMTSSAPVTIGNTVTGVATKSRTTRNGHVVLGREFLTTAYGSGTIATWTSVAGVPLTPVTFVDSLLRMYGSMYDYFKWNKLTVHYVTTSPTSSNGSVMLYYHKDRAGVFLNQTSANLLPFVLTDPHTCITPQWQNMSVTLETDSQWKRTDYGVSDDVGHYAAGELFLLSKTSTSDSPGYLLMDYEIEFKDMNLTPRLLLWPQPSIIYTPYAFRTTSQTANSYLELGYVAGQAGNPFGAVPSSLGSSRVYKVVFDITNSSGVASGTDTFNVLMSPGGAAASVTIADGTTMYAVAVSGGTTFRYYTNAAAAYSGSACEVALFPTTGTVTTTYVIWYSLVGLLGSAGVNPSM